MLAFKLQITSKYMTLFEFICTRSIENGFGIGGFFFQFR